MKQIKLQNKSNYKIKLSHHKQKESPFQFFTACQTFPLAPREILKMKKLLRVSFFDETFSSLNSWAEQV